jgi:hypothetical protein
VAAVCVLSAWPFRASRVRRWFRMTDHGGVAR